MSSLSAFLPASEECEPGVHKQEGPVPIPQGWPKATLPTVSPTRMGSLVPWAQIKPRRAVHCQNNIYDTSISSVCDPWRCCRERKTPGFGWLGGTKEEVPHFRTQLACGRQGRRGDCRILLGGREDSGASVLCITQAPILGPSSQRGERPPWASPSPGSLNLKPVPEHKPSKGCHERGKKNPWQYVRLTPQTRRHQDHQ